MIVAVSTAGRDGVSNNSHVLQLAQSMTVRIVTACWGCHMLMCEPVLAENSDTELCETTILIMILEEIWQECCHFNNDLSPIHGGFCRLQWWTILSVSPVYWD